MTEPLEFLVFSDFHAHNFPYGATRTQIPGLGGLYNSRLADSAEVLDWILKHAMDEGIKNVVFCGDLFHRRTSVATDVRHVVVDRLHKFADEDIHLHMIPGNHDMGDRKGNYHSLVGLGELSEFVHVHTDVFKTSVDGADFIFVPYTDNKEEAKIMLQAAGELADTSAQPAILFAHLGMQGAVVGSDYVLINESDISVPDVPHDKFAACFFGHFHEHQQLFGNGWFVGATHQHNWGDAGGLRGHLHVTVTKGKVSFEHIKNLAPEFVVTRDDEKPFIKKNDFVKYITKEQYIDREALRVKWGLDNPPEIVIDTEEEETEFTLDASQLSPANVIVEWVNRKLPEGLTEEEVLLEGSDILKEVGL